jgi:hypothetical protein
MSLNSEIKIVIEKGPTVPQFPLSEKCYSFKKIYLNMEFKLTE